MNRRWKLFTILPGIVGCLVLLGVLASSAYGQLVIIDQTTGADITATYLPEPGQTVELQGGASFVLTTTTNYPPAFDQLVTETKAKKKTKTKRKCKGQCT